MFPSFYTFRSLFLSSSFCLCLLFACQSEKPTTVSTAETSEQTAVVSEAIAATEEVAPIAETATPVAATVTEAKPSPALKTTEAPVKATKSVADQLMSAAKAQTPPVAVKPIVAKPAEQPSNSVTNSKLMAAKETEPEAAINYKGEPKAAAAAKGAAITFDETSYDFGTILIGTIIEHDFTFKNSGSIPLIIKDAASTCGCTIPEIPNAPIMPGQSGKIHVVFDSKGKIGTQNKVVTVYTNAGTREIALKGIGLTANLMKKDKEEEKGEK